MAKVLIFAGTTEGGDLAAYLAGAGVQVHVCVASEYGRTSVPVRPGIEVSARPLSTPEMAALMREYTLVIDATHPYAQEIKRHVAEVCAQTGAEYVRLSRSSAAGAADVITVPTVEAAVDYLKNTAGPVLVTTGSKELAAFAALPGYQERVFARVLSLPDVVAQCAAAGFQGKNLFAMQGPFCEELDYGLLVQTGARYLVTKDSGVPGGFPAKLAAAQRAGAQVVLIGRPAEPAGGRDYEATVAYLADRLRLPAPAVAPRALALVGTGIGPGTGLTAAAAEAVRNADMVCGAARMLQVPEAAGKPTLPEYQAAKILAYLVVHPEVRRAAVLVSGDVGFYSAAKALEEQAVAAGFRVTAHCGISSVQYLCARAGVPWQDVRLVSAHGRPANVVAEIRTHARTFVLLDGAQGVKDLCTALTAYGLADVQLTVGCDLGYPEERILTGRTAELAAHECGQLCAALIMNP